MLLTVRYNTSLLNNIFCISQYCPKYFYFIIQSTYLSHNYYGEMNRNREKWWKVMVKSGKMVITLRICRISCKLLVLILNFTKKYKGEFVDSHISPKFLPLPLKRCLYLPEIYSPISEIRSRFQKKLAFRLFSSRFWDHFHTGSPTTIHSSATTPIIF